MRTSRAIIAAVYFAALAVILAVSLAACQDTQGAVTARIHHGKWRYLAVRQADGRTVRHRVGLLSRAWRHCRIGDPYPHCRQSAK